METKFHRSQISTVEVLGVKATQISMPQWLRKYEDRPLWSYKIFLKYKGAYSRGPKRKKKTLSGRCILTLSTKINRYGELVMVQGCASLKGYSKSEASTINFKPKQKIVCPGNLKNIVADYIGSSGLYTRYFDEADLYIIQNPLFSCNRKEVSLVYGYNKDGLLDQVSVDMSLFEPIIK